MSVLDAKIHSLFDEENPNSVQAIAGDVVPNIVVVVLGVLLIGVAVLTLLNVKDVVAFAGSKAIA